MIVFSFRYRLRSFMLLRIELMNMPEGVFPVNVSYWLFLQSNLSRIIKIRT